METYLLSIFLSFVLFLLGYIIMGKVFLAITVVLLINFICFYFYKKNKIISLMGLIENNKQFKDFIRHHHTAFNFYSSCSRVFYVKTLDFYLAYWRFDDLESVNSREFLLKKINCDRSFISRFTSKNLLLALSNNDFINQKNIEENKLKKINKELSDEFYKLQE